MLQIITLYMLTGRLFIEIPFSEKRIKLNSYFLETPYK